MPSLFSPVGVLRREWRLVVDSLPRMGEAVLYRTEFYQAMGIYEGGDVWRCSNGELETVLILCWQSLFE